MSKCSVFLISDACHSHFSSELSSVASSSSIAATPSSLAATPTSVRRQILAQQAALARGRRRMRTSSTSASGEDDFRTRLSSNEQVIELNYSIVVVVFAGLRLNNAWASGTVLRPSSTTRKPPFLTEFGLRLQVQASRFELTTPILEAARSNHWAIHHPRITRLYRWT